MALFKKTDAQEIEPKLPRGNTPPWERDKMNDATADAEPEYETPRRVSFAVIVSRVFFALAVLGLLASVAAISLIWIYARDTSSAVVILLITAAIVTGIIAHALTDKAI